MQLTQLPGGHVNLHASHRQGAGWLQDRAGVFKNILDRGAYLIGGNGDHAIHHLAGDCKAVLAHLAHGHAIGEQPHLLQPHPPACRQRAGHRIGIHGLNANDLHLGPERLYIGPDAGNQATAAHRHVDHIRWLRTLAQDLQGDGALASDHVRVVEGVDEAEAPFSGESPGLAAGGVVVVAVQHHLGAAIQHRLHLHLGGGDRHHDHGPAAQGLGPEGHSLGVIAGAGGNHAQRQLLGAEARHLVVGAPQLETEHRLQVFSFQQHPVGEAGRQGGGRIQGRLDGHVIDAGPQDPLQIVGGG